MLEHEVYASWWELWGRLPPPPSPSPSLFQRAIIDIQEQEDRRAFEMLGGIPQDPPTRFDRI